MNFKINIVYYYYIYNRHKVPTKLFSMKSQHLTHYTHEQFSTKGLIHGEYLICKWMKKVGIKQE